VLILPALLDVMMLHVTTKKLDLPDNIILLLTVVVTVNSRICNL